MKPLITLALCLVLVGCNKMQSQVSFEPAPVEDPAAKLKARSCEWDPADYELRTHLLAFEMTNKDNFSFGFNLLNQFLKAFQVSFKVNKGQMIFRMDLSKPQDSGNPILNAMGKAEYSKREIGFTIDFAAIQAGMNSQSAVPLTTLVERGLTNTLNETKNQLQQLPLEWATHVSEVKDNKARIPVGLLAGLRKGDEFSIFNVEAQWDGEPCQSHYYGEYKTSPSPAATGIVTDINETTAFLELTDVKEDVGIGSRVEISKLQGGRTTLLKSIRLIGVSSEPITLENGAKINLLPYVTEIIKPVVNKGGFYIRQ